jgi:hypothetical protein
MTKDEKQNRIVLYVQMGGSAFPTKTNKACPGLR